jgi:hypothetical protein
MIIPWFLDISYHLISCYQENQHLQVILTDHSQSLSDFQRPQVSALACSNKIMRYAAARLCASVAFLSHPLWLNGSRILNWIWFVWNPMAKMKWKWRWIRWEYGQQPEKSCNCWYVTCLRGKLSVIHGSSMGFADFDSIPRPSLRNPKNIGFPLNMA